MGTESARERRRRTCKTRGKDGNMPRRRGGGGGARRGRGSGGGFFSSPANQSQAPPPAVPQQRQGGGFFFDHGTGVCSGNGVSHCTRSYSRRSALFFRGRRTRGRRSCSTAAASWNWCS